jgi:nitrate reductase beta subunit
MVGAGKRKGLLQRRLHQCPRTDPLADYEDRFVIPTTHREQVEEAYELKGGCGFTDGNGCSTGISKGSLFGGSKKPLKMPEEVR